MKKTKKLLSLFLAALMLMSCFGAISASAMTMEAAEAAAVEFNANQVDHSAVYANKSAKEWNKTMTDLDKTLGVALKALSIKNSIYADSTVNMMLSLDGIIFDLVNNLAKDPDAGMLGSVLKLALMRITPSAMGKAMEKAGVYPEVATYLKTVTSYNNLDTSKLVWGVDAGNREEFATAASWALYPTITALNLVTSLLVDVYDDVALILESLHQGPVASQPEFRALADKDAASAGLFFLNPICDAIDDLAANPLTYICEILPDVTNSVSVALKALKGNGLIGGYLGDLPDGLSGLIPMIVPMIPSLLGLGEDYVMPELNLPEIDEHYLITMGNAYAAESGVTGGARMAIKGNETMVFAAVAQYVQEVLQDKGNQAAIGDLVVAKAGPEYLDSYRDVVNAAVNGTSIDVADACLSLIEKVAKDAGAQENVNPIVAFFAKIAAFFSNLAKKIIALFK